MRDHFKPFPPIPKETTQAADAIFGRNNFYMVIGEHLDALLEDIRLPGLSGGNRPSSREAASWALITIFQFLEGLTDVQAVDAIRSRLDWKFALHLPLVPVRFHEYVFCEFRQRILKDPASQHEFQRLMGRVNTLRSSPNRDSQKVNSREVAAFVCSINRLNHAQQAMNQALEVLAARFPDWLRKTALPHWYGRYNRVIPRLEVAILLGQQHFLTEEIGSDIQHLLKKVHQSDPPELAELPEVKMLDRLWAQQFKVPDQMSKNLPEDQSLKGCATCAYRGGGRRL
ncbi:MAG TPA: transposase [Anaerolineales bacterium]|nr:transposase [Anaerolineales bacterium]